MAKRNKNKFTKRAIQSELYECRFDPNEVGPFKIILDMKSATYFENRAIELVKLAQDDSFHVAYDETVTKAIQLLIVAKIMRRQLEEGKTGECGTE